MRSLYSFAHGCNSCTRGSKADSHICSRNSFGNSLNLWNEGGERLKGLVRVFRALEMAMLFLIRIGLGIA
jgi:hypothetical protein